MASLALRQDSGLHSLLGAVEKKIVPACIALILALQVHHVFARAINWDEFYFYSQVEQYVTGRLTAPLQTFHVQLFAWLASLPGSGVDHIVAGRLVMFAAELTTTVAIFCIAAHFAGRETGRMAALAYLGSIYVFQHGYAFRVDPLATALTMSALAILLTSRLRLIDIAAVAIMLGLSGMVTIKSVLLAPAFVGVAWMRWSEANHAWTYAARLFACAAAALAVFGVLYGLHSWSLTSPAVTSGMAYTASKATVSSSTSYVIALGLPAFPKYLGGFTLGSLLQVVAILLSPIAILRAELPPARKAALTGMLATALVFFFYRNTLPYFYSFILPPLLCGAAPKLREMLDEFPPALLAAVVTVAPIASWIVTPTNLIDRQRTLVEAADTIFPQPVAYFDFAGMLGTFEKANVFMTTWGIVSYRIADVPVMRQRMEQTTVPLVLASEQESYLTFEQMLTSEGRSPYFVAADAAALRDNYLRFWGPYWIAGKAVPAHRSARRSEFLVPGPYTVYDGPVEIDGRAYAPGDVIHVERGFHTLAASGDRSARLFWGDRLARPNTPPPPRPYWTDF